MFSDALGCDLVVSQDRACCHLEKSHHRALSNTNYAPLTAEGHDVFHFPFFAVLHMRLPMSACLACARSVSQRAADPKGDRVNLVMSEKFVGYKSY
jgi:hypothetical protein